MIIEANQGLIPLDDVTLEHKNRADWICLAEEIHNLIRNAAATPILCLICLDLREIYGNRFIISKFKLFRVSERAADVDLWVFIRKKSQLDVNINTGAMSVKRPINWLDFRRIMRGSSLTPCNNFTAATARLNNLLRHNGMEGSIGAGKRLEKVNANQAVLTFEIT